LFKGWTINEGQRLTGVKNRSSVAESTKKAAKIKGTIKQIDEGNTEGLNIVYMKNLDVYRVRIGDFRVIYEIQDDELVLIVIKVGPRGDVYK
jgi:mRNA interferase RelE/StbE